MVPARFDSRRSEICDELLKWAVPSVLPFGSTTSTASPAAAWPRSTTSLAKIQGWPEATRPAAFRLTRTVCKSSVYSYHKQRLLRSRDQINKGTVSLRSRENFETPVAHAPG